jgi:microcystin-dependent protein
MGAAAIGLAGSSQPHDNMPPFLAMTYFIALYGIFPSQN